MEKIRLVVYNEHTLGYIQPERPARLCHLHASILKGAPWSMTNHFSLITHRDTVRLAGQEDFDEFRVSMDGYKNQPEVYEFKKDLKKVS